MSNKPLLLGITGGIGSGKSTVCHLFSLLGIPVYNADERAKWLVAHDSYIREQIIHFFGEESFQKGLYNRAYISSLVFNSPDKLKQLNAIIHPVVGQDFEHWVISKGNEFPYLVKEAALLFDSGNGNQLDQIAVVHAPNDKRIKRVESRDPQRNNAQIRDIISQQMSQEEMIKRADYLIDNSGSRLLIPQIIQIDSSIKSRD